MWWGCDTTDWRCNVMHGSAEKLEKSWFYYRDFESGWRAPQWLTIDMGSIYQEVWTWMWTWIRMAITIVMACHAMGRRDGTREAHSSMQCWSWEIWYARRQRSNNQRSLNERIFGFDPKGKENADVNINFGWCSTISQTNHNINGNANSKKSMNTSTRQPEHLCPWHGEPICQIESHYDEVLLDNLWYPTDHMVLSKVVLIDARTCNSYLHSRRLLYHAWFLIKLCRHIFILWFIKENGYEKFHLHHEKVLFL